jgi:hypothetical protein
MATIFPEGSLTETKFSAIWPQAGSPKWLSQWPLFSNVATSDGHYFSRKFPDKNYFLAILPQGTSDGQLFSGTP